MAQVVFISNLLGSLLGVSLTHFQLFGVSWVQRGSRNHKPTKSSRMVWCDWSSCLCLRETRLQRVLCQRHFTYWHNWLPGTSSGAISAVLTFRIAEVGFREGGGGLVAHDCGYPLSRYTCRAIRVAADFLDFIAFCRCSTGVALHPLRISVSHLAPPPLSREVSHRNLGLKRCRATRGCRSYSCRCRATLCN